MAPFRLGYLAQVAEGRLVGDPERLIRGIRSLVAAGPEDLSFVTEGRFVEQAESSRAGALLVSKEVAQGTSLSGDRIECDDPQRALARLLDAMVPVSRPAAGVHETAVVGEGSTVDPTAHVGPYVVIGRDCEIGSRVVLHPQVVLGDRCRLAEDVVVHAHVSVYEGTEIGARSILHSGCVVGADGFRYAQESGVPVKIRQVGRVVIGPDVEIGANSAIDRASLESTRIGAGTKIDNLVQVAHNVDIGRGCILCGQAGIAGSSRLGDGVVLAGQVGVVDHVELGDRVQAAARAAVLQSVSAGEVVAGFPAQPITRWRRQVAFLARLTRFRSRLRRLERAVFSAADDDPRGIEERGGNRE